MLIIVLLLIVILFLRLHLILYIEYQNWLLGSTIISKGENIYIVFNKLNKVPIIGTHNYYL